MNDSIKSAYMSMVVESVGFSDDVDLIIESVETLFEAEGDRPSDKDINSKIQDRGFKHLTFSVKPSKFDEFTEALGKTHKAKVSEVKKGLGVLGKLTVKTISNSPTRLQTHVCANGHPVAEVMHIAAASNEKEYPHWDKVGKFTAIVNGIPKVNIDLHKEHLEKLAESGSKAKPKFQNSSVIVSALDKMTEHSWGHGSQMSLNTKQKSLVSTAHSGVCKHVVKDVWDKYD